MVLRRLLLASLLLPWAALADVEPGNWELTLTADIQGAGSTGPVVQTKCVTADDARDPSRLLGTASGGCDFSNRRDSGEVFSFDISCIGLIPMRGSGTVRYSAQSLEADLDLAADAGGQKLGLRSRISGRRLGPCTQ